MGRYSKRILVLENLDCNTLLVMNLRRVFERVM